jgi:hypothetical protein
MDQLFPIIFMMNISQRINIGFRKAKKVVNNDKT